MEASCAQIRACFLIYFTAEQLKRETNGCGPQGLGWLLPDVDSELCDAHDLLYSLGLLPSEKKKVDAWFVRSLQIRGFQSVVVHVSRFLLRYTNFGQRKALLIRQLTHLQYSMLKSRVLNLL